MLIERTAIVLLLFLTSVAAAADTMSGMHSQAGDHPWTNSDDVRFLSAMVAHHQGAVAMAKKTEDSPDETVAQWSRDIVENQENEIVLMESLLELMGGRDYNAEQAMRRDMDAMTTRRVSDNDDANMVMLMIPHHSAAIEMALPALANSQNFQVRKLAKEIIMSQTQEIDHYRDWLDKNRL